MSRFFGKPVHAAFVVPELDDVLARMLKSGIGPIFTLRNLRLPGRYRGVRRDAVFTAAFAVTGAVQYEILHQHDETPSAYREFLEKNPQGGLHHIAYYSENFQADIQRAKEGGVEFSIVQEYLTPDGPPFEIYMEPVGEDNPLLVQLMYRGPSEIVFDRIEQIAATWDGSEPIRDMFQLMPQELVLPTAD